VRSSRSSSSGPKPVHSIDTRLDLTSGPAGG
jgi:hypothetical protein